MAVLIRPRRWGRVKPPPGAHIDRGHPLAQGLQVCVILNGSSRPVDLALNQTCTIPNGLTLGNSAYGEELSRFTSASSQYVNLGAVPMGGDLAQFTIATRFYVTGYAAGQILVAKDRDTGGRPFTLDVSTSQNARFYVEGGTDILNANFVTAANTVYSAVGSWVGGGFMGFYRDGVLIESKTATVTSLAASPTVDLRIGGRHYSGFEDYLGGGLSYAYVWNRALTRNEAAWLHAEPYAFIQPPGPRILYLGISSGSQTHTAAGSSTVNVDSTGMGAVPAPEQKPSGFVVGRSEPRREPLHTRSIARIRFTLTPSDRYRVRHVVRTRLTLTPSDTVRTVAIGKQRAHVRGRDTIRARHYGHVRLEARAHAGHTSASKAHVGFGVRAYTKNATRPIDLLRAAREDADLIELLTRF